LQTSLKNDILKLESMFFRFNKNYNPGGYWSTRADTTVSVSRTDFLIFIKKSFQKTFRDEYLNLSTFQFVDLTPDMVEKI
jgi:hypothetical protein